MHMWLEARIELEPILNSYKFNVLSSNMSSLAWISSITSLKVLISWSKFNVHASNNILNFILFSFFFLNVKSNI
jgi:hypothetical protein